LGTLRGLLNVESNEPIAKFPHTETN